MSVCVCLYPVGEVNGGNSFFSPLNLDLHLAPVLGTGVNGTNFTHDAAHREQIDKKISQELEADVFFYMQSEKL